MDRTSVRPMEALVQVPTPPVTRKLPTAAPSGPPGGLAPRPAPDVLDSQIVAMLEDALPNLVRQAGVIGRGATRRERDARARELERRLQERGGWDEV